MSNNTTFAPISWDKKIAIYTLLTYAMYGIFNIFQLNDFVVPLPMVYGVVPLIALVYLVTTPFSVLSAAFILMPIVIIKDIFIGDHPNIVYPLVIASCLCWMTIGIHLIVGKKITFLKYSKLLGITLCLIPVALINAPINLSWFVLPVVGIAAYLFYEKNSANRSILVYLRIALLLVVISGLYGLTILSFLTI